MFSTFLALVAAVTPVTSSAARTPTPPDIRLYTLDCGRLELDDMRLFADTGEHAGQKGTMAVACYLIRDGDRWLLWDTGLGDELAAYHKGRHILGGRWIVHRTLTSQLAALGLTAADISFVGLSHLHADHSGNLGLFPQAMVLLGAHELAWAKAGGIGTDPAIVAAAARAPHREVAGDEDVFGDGRVWMLATPGHTPGHHALLVDLPHSGPVLLTGDLYHTRENLVMGLVPEVNVSRADTLASFDRFRRIAANRHARIVVQHSAEDFAAMPAFPRFLD